MDELLRDFLTETTEHIEGAETQLVQFERDPTDASLVASIFRLVHTIKGTSSFLGLDRLQHVAHAAETLIGDLRDGAPPTPRTVSLILSMIDRIKLIIAEVEEHGSEREGDDSDLTAAIQAHSTELPPGTDFGPNAGAGQDLDHEPEKEAEEAEAAAPATDQVAEKRSRQSSAKEPGGRSHQNSGPETIRVAVDTIERIMQLVSELVLTRNQLLELTRHRDDDTVKSPLQRLSALTTDLQDAVMRARMQPVGRLYANLPRLVRELSTELSKKIDLVTEGADTELDRQLIEVIRDPLTHMIRNCADHGIETPEVRLQSGKPEFGVIRVSASHEAGQITIDIVDDGRGLDVERIKKKIVSTGLASEQDLLRMSSDEVYRFIFEPGFSTAQKVTNVSGRGVGMDVVKSNIESIGGSVSVSSTPGHGSRFSLKIPLTLAIAPALIIEVGDQRFALPQHAVVEVVGVGKESGHQVESVQNALVLKLRDEVLPVLELRSILGIEAAHKSQGSEPLVVITRVGSTSFGVIVDGVADVQEIVVKPLSASLGHLKSFSGHTILGDGSVVLILDPGGIAANLGVEKAAEKEHEAAKEVQAQDRTRLVLFRAGSGSPKVLPLSLVARIEMVEPGRIERSDGKLLMLHQGRLMPIIPVAQSFDMPSRPHPVLVLSAEQRTIGLLVDEIVDIVEQKLDIQLASQGPDIVGSAEIRGEAVELIDVSYYFQAGYPDMHLLHCSVGRKVLLLDDALSSRDMILPVLTAAGYTVSAVGSSSEVSDLLKQDMDFDAVITDLGSADNARHRLVASLLRQLPLGGKPVIGLVAYPTPGALMAAREAGIENVVSRFDRQSLLSILSSAIESMPPRISGDRSTIAGLAA